MVQAQAPPDSFLRQGTIYTFYSFKGGVGRSMALANLAEIFHQKGLRVVMVDWDLEAPGLETYFYSTGYTSQSIVMSARARRGLIDLMLDYRSAYPSIATRRAAAADKTTDHSIEHAMKMGSALVAELSRQRPDLPEFLRKNPFIHSAPASFSQLLEELYQAGTFLDPRKEFPATLATSALRAFLQCIHAPSEDYDNGLYLMSAGSRAGDQFPKYASAVQEFDWAEFYAAYDGREYFTWFREKLAEIADIVLIDSRTGVTEMGGVCTRHLPDVVVSFCAPNSQNVEGILGILSGVNRSDVKQARDDRHIKNLVIPSRIDTSESDRLDDFSRQFATKIESSELVPESLQGLERPFWGLQIPYIPRYNYREERVIGADVPATGEVGQKLIDAYQRIAVRLAMLSPVGSRLQEAYAAEIGAVSGDLGFSSIFRSIRTTSTRQLVFLSHSGEDTGAARELARQLAQAGLDVWLDVERLKPGDRWREMIEEVLHQATALVVYVGKSGVRDWVDQEVRVALDRSTKDPNFRLIPLLGPGSDPARLPLFLKQYQWLDLRQGLTEATQLQKLIAQLQKLIEGATQRPAEGVSLLPPGKSPFRGLHAFDVEDSLLFFGRDAEIRDLLERLRDDSFLAVVGDSGSGKSSLVRAGLIPALHRGRFHDGKGWVESWRVAITRPRDDPFGELALALADLKQELSYSERADLVGNLTERLLATPDGLPNLITGLVPGGYHTLLVVDQFEELFTLARKADPERNERPVDKWGPYVDALFATAGSKVERPVHVVITLRADFYRHIWDHKELFRRTTANQYNVRQASAERLREVIEKPLALAGAKAEPGLVDLILADVGDEPGNLPLLEHTLSQLWERRKGNEITHDAYREIGRLGGALKNHADRVLESLAPQNQEMARKILLRLIQPGEGTEDTRRRARMAELKGLGGADSESVEKVLFYLIGARLVTSSSEGTTAEEILEISHEVLIREWPRLRRWVDESRDDLRIERKILEVATEWGQAKQDPGLLWTGTRLAQTNEWALRHKQEVSPNSPTARFLEASRQQAAVEVRKARRLRRLALAMALAAVAAVVGFVGWIAYDANRRAKEEQARARKLFEERIVSAPPLMWTRTDNLESVNWNDANQYCENLTLGDYSDWRLPTIEELQRVYDREAHGKYKIRKPFQLTGSWVWSSTREGSDSAWIFQFDYGDGRLLPLDLYNDVRALCVRGH